MLEVENSYCLSERQISIDSKNGVHHSMLVPFTMFDEKCEDVANNRSSHIHYVYWDLLLSFWLEEGHNLKHDVWCIYSLAPFVSIMRSPLPISLFLALILILKILYFFVVKATLLRDFNFLVRVQPHNLVKMRDLMASKLLQILFCGELLDLLLFLLFMV